MGARTALPARHRAHRPPRPSPTTLPPTPSRRRRTTSPLGTPSRLITGGHNTVGTYDFGAEENLIGSTTTGGSWTYVAESGTTNHNVLVVDSLHGDANYDKVVSTVTLAGNGAVPIGVTMAPNGSAAYVLDGPTTRST